MCVCACVCACVHVFGAELILFGKVSGTVHIRKHEWLTRSVLMPMYTCKVFALSLWLPQHDVVMVTKSN